MRLTKLEIFGFKSFARRTEIIFPQNITGIVGPNGSGKSNIADAVRWVLGEQSARLLRGHSMADVIFNGTEKKKAMNYCEVTLVFDNSDKQLDTIFEEVSVSRRVYRSGESEYLLNNTSCRLKDIVTLFQGTGIGREGYSIIGQGRIDDILSQRSEDRRAVFEEAAGISRYRSRKEEAESRLKRADENLQRVDDVLTELETRLGPLEKQSKTAKEFLTLSETLRELDIRLYILKHRSSHKLEQEALKKLSEAKIKFDDEVTHLEQMVEKRNQNEIEISELQNALQKANEHLLAVSELLHTHKQDALTTLNMRDNAKESIERLTLTADAIRNRMKIIASTMNHGKSSYIKAVEIEKSANDALENAQLEFDQTTLEMVGLEKELVSLRNRMDEQRNQAQSVKEQTTRQLTMKQQLFLRMDDVKEQLENEKSQSQVFSEAQQEAKLHLANSKETLNNKQFEVQAISEGYQMCIKRLNTNTVQMQTKLQNIQAIKSRHKTLTELQDGYEGYQFSVKNALAYAKKNNLSGIHNVVALLLEVPKEYETALDMALGVAMQNIVTDTAQDAKKLIEYLRANRLGRATFLPLNTIKARTLTQQERFVLRLPGCIGVASELCNYDEKYKPIIDNLLGRTIIAEDLQTGIQIMNQGRHAFKLVTLTGDVMHAGGSMTGGSISQKAQNLLGREREIRELSETISADIITIENLQKNLKADELQKQQLQDKLSEARHQVHQQEIAIVRDTERLNNAVQAMDAHLNRVDNFETGIEQLSFNLQSIEETLEQLQKVEGKETADGESLDIQSSEFAKKLDFARRNRENIQEILTNAKLTLQDATYEVQRVSADQERLNNDYKSSETDLAENLQNITNNELQYSEAEEQYNNLISQISQTESIITSAKDNVESSEIARNLKQQSLKALQSDIDQAQQNVHLAEESVTKGEFVLTRIKGELSQLNERMWDNYEMTYALADEALQKYDSQKSEIGVNFNEQDAQQEAKSCRERIKQMGSIHVGAIEEYAELHERFTTLTTQKDDIVKAKQDLQTLITTLLTQMRTVFVREFSMLQTYFSTSFERLFGGGRGELLLSDKSDPLNCGIEIIVQPPGKKRQLLSLFSGGERALTAIALLFAMLMLKPTPFCILDEIEAALDEANVAYFANYLKEFSEETQFVVVTHRKGTMERCDTLFGVAMEERGISSMVSVNLTDYQ